MIWKSFQVLCKSPLVTISETIIYTYIIPTFWLFKVGRAFFPFRRKLAGWKDTISFGMPAVAWPSWTLSLRTSSCIDPLVQVPPIVVHMNQPSRTLSATRCSVRNRPVLFQIEEGSSTCSITYLSLTLNIEYGSKFLRMWNWCCWLFFVSLTFQLTLTKKNHLIKIPFPVTGLSSTFSVMQMSFLQSVHAFLSPRLLICFFCASRCVTADF